VIQGYYDMEDEVYCKRLGKIEEADITDHGRSILGISICFDFGGSSQCMSPVVDNPLKINTGEFISRVGTLFGCELIRLLMVGFNVTRFSDIKGKTALALYRKDGGAAKRNEMIDGIEIPSQFRGKHQHGDFIIDTEQVLEYCERLEKIDQANLTEEEGIFFQKKLKDG